MSFLMDRHASLGQVKLYVSDLTRSVRFYTQIIGLELISESSTEDAGSAAAPAIARLGAGGETLLELEQLSHAAPAAQPKRGYAGLYHFALLLPDRKALSRTLHHFIANGIAIGQADHLVSEALYLSDPDQHGIEIYADRPRSQWEKDAAGNYVMATNPLDWDGLLAEAEGESWTGLPPQTTMGHVHLHVSDLAATRAFYTGQLGFEVVGNYLPMKAVFMAFGGYHHHLGTNIWAGAGAVIAPPHLPRLGYYTIVLPHAEAFEQLIAHLQQQQAAFRWLSAGTADSTTVQASALASAQANQAALTDEQASPLISLQDPSGVEVRITRLAASVSK